MSNPATAHNNRHGCAGGQQPATSHTPLVRSNHIVQCLAHQAGAALRLKLQGTQEQAAAAMLLVRPHSCELHSLVTAVPQSSSEGWRPTLLAVQSCCSAPPKLYAVTTTRMK
jgi:hypothetical protein